MPRKKRLEEIRERYQLTHASPESSDLSIRSDDSASSGVFNQDTADRDQSGERYAQGYTGRVESAIGNDATGQGHHRELHRGDGLDYHEASTGNGRPYQSHENTDAIRETEPGTGQKRGGKRLRFTAIPPVIGKEGADGRSDKPASRPLTKAEANGLREKLTAALIQIFRSADDIIRVTNGSHEFIPIWSTIDDSDIAIIVSRRLEAAQRSPYEAKIVVAIINTWERWAIYAIMLPRIGHTINAYVEHGFDIPLPRKTVRKRPHESEEQYQARRAYQARSRRERATVNRDEILR